MEPDLLTTLVDLDVLRALAVAAESDFATGRGRAVTRGLGVFAAIALLVGLFRSGVLASKQRIVPAAMGLMALAFVLALLINPSLFTSLLNFLGGIVGRVMRDGASTIGAAWGLL